MRIRAQFFALLHCGVAETHRPLRAACPRTLEAAAAELRAWERAVASGPVDGRAGCRGGASPLARRLSARCYDLLCSTQSCFEHTVQACAARLARGPHAPATAVLRERCEAWARHLPLALGPQCDALTGTCQAPPDAHPGQVLWPDAACLDRGGRAMCAAASQGRARCAPCIVKRR